MGTGDEARLDLRDTVLELVHHAVHRGEGVGGGGPGPDDEPVALHGDLADLAFGDAGVALLRELDLGPLHAPEAPPHPRDLVLDRGAQRLGHLDVATVDGDVHPTLLSLPAPGTAAQGLAPRPHRAWQSGCRLRLSARCGPDSLPQAGGRPMPQCRQFGPRRPGWPWD